MVLDEQFILETASIYGIEIVKKEKTENQTKFTRKDIFEMFDVEISKELKYFLNKNIFDIYTNETDLGAA